jgi:hypothetical protein
MDVDITRHVCLPPPTVSTSGFVRGRDWRIRWPPTLGVPIESFARPLRLALTTKCPSLNEQPLRLVELLDDVARGALAGPTHGRFIHQMTGLFPGLQLEDEEAG